MRACVLLFFTALSWITIQAQTAKVDSLLQVAKTTDSMETKVQSYLQAAWLSIDVDLTKAFAYNDSAFNISKRHQYKNGIADAYFKYAVLNRALGDYDKALGYLEKYEQLSKDDSLKLANVAFQRGIIYSIKGDIDEGLKNYHKTIEYYQLLGEKRGLGMTYNVIGITFSNVKRYDEAIANYKKSIAILKAINDKDALASTYHNLANVYDYKNEYDTALTYFEKSLAMSEQTHNVLRIAQTKQNMGGIYKDQKDYDKAAAVVLEGYNLLKDNNYKGNMIGAAADLAEIYTLMGRYNESERLLKAQLDSVNGTLKGQSKLYFSLFKLYETTGRPKAALEYFKTYKTLSDSLISENGLKNLNQLQVKFNVEKKDKELAQQRLALEQQETEIKKKKNQNRFMWAFVVFLLLSSLLLWFLFRQRQKRKDQEIMTLKREQQVKTLENLIEGEENERLRIAKELHDGVNGGLSAIKYKLTSQLEQNNRIISEAVAMIDKSCEQVRAISYNLVPPSLKNFSLVEALEDYLGSMNAIHEPEITFQHIGEPIHLAIKVEINIFRIVQEMVNNSLKHAEATEINVQVSHRDNRVQLTVEDNGKGFDKDTVMGNGMGLVNIKSRVEYLNAKLDFSSNEQGTSYMIEINTNTLH